MIRKMRMSKGIDKSTFRFTGIRNGAGLVPAVPGGTVHAKAEGGK